MSISKPLVFDEASEIYGRYEINRETLAHLGDIGLVQFQDSRAFRLNFSSNRVVAEYYGNQLHLEMSRDVNSELEVGIALFTPIGEVLAPVCRSEPVDGFYEYVREQWKLYLT